MKNNEKKSKKYFSSDEIVRELLPDFYKEKFVDTKEENPMFFGANLAERSLKIIEEMLEE